MSAISSRLIYLDVLRGLAASLVLLNHIAIPIAKSDAAPEWARNLSEFVFVNTLDFGRLGVALFFLISGFVIPYSLSPKQGLNGFAISRAFRLYPVYWAAICISLVLYGAINIKFDLLTIAANVTMAPQVFGRPWIDGVYWTLFIEIVFYAFCAILYVFSSLKNFAVVSISVMLLSILTILAVFTNHLFSVRLPIQYITFHLSFLLFGYVVRLVVECRSQGGGMVAALLAAWLLACVYALCHWVDAPYTPLGEAKGAAIFNSYILAFIVFAVSIIMSKPNSSRLVWIGTISYSLYLIHWPITAVFLHYIGIYDVWRLMWYIILSISSSFFVASLMYFMFEVPSIKAGRWVRATVSKKHLVLTD